MCIGPYTPAPQRLLTSAHAAASSRCQRDVSALDHQAEGEKIDTGNMCVSVSRAPPPQGKRRSNKHKKDTAYLGSSACPCRTPLRKRRQEITSSPLQRKRVLYMHAHREIRRQHKSPVPHHPSSEWHFATAAAAHHKNHHHYQNDGLGLNNNLFITKGPKPSPTDKNQVIEHPGTRGTEAIHHKARYQKHSPPLCLLPDALNKGRGEETQNQKKGYERRATPTWRG